MGSEMCIRDSVNNVSVIICQGDSLFVENAWQQAAGVYNDTLLALDGCDSIVETTLTVTPSPVVSQTITICQGDSSLIFGTYETVAGTYQETVQTAAGCDSINEIVLVVNPTYFVQETESICQGDSSFLQGSYQSSAGLYLDTLLTLEGCDSIIETNLIVNPTYFLQETEVICQGDSIFLEGAYQTTGGTYTDTLLAAAGCDSIIETNLTVNPSYFVQETLSICQGDSVLLEGVYQTTSGTYLDTTLTVTGCDSIVETALTVNPAPVYSSTIAICQGDSTLIFGNYETVAGTYTETLQTAAGCDSINEVDLVVNPTFFEQETLTICEGDSVLLGGAFQTTSGVYTDTLQTASSCDSIIETTLTVNPAPTSTDAITICNGDSVLVNGTYLSAAGTYVDTLQTASGCDSIVTTTLSVTVIDATVSDNSPTLTANYSGAQSYQWINCDSGNNIANGTSQSYTAIANGSYQVLISDQGCSALSDCYDVLNISVSEYELSNIEIYPNPTSDLITVIYDQPNADMLLVDAHGREIMTLNVGKEFTLSLKDYPNGVYFMSLGGKVFRLVKE